MPLDESMLETVFQHIRHGTDTELQGKLQNLEDLRTPLAVGTLASTEAALILDLTIDNSDVFALKQHERFEIPPLLQDIMEVHEAVLIMPIALTEAIARATINEILIICVHEERKSAFGYTKPAMQPSARPSTPPPEPSTLHLRFETRLNYPVMFKSRKRLLQGVADYTLWYSGSESMASNLIIIETKRRDDFSKGIAQVTAYMGIVHRIRKDQEKKNKVVYGMITDGKQFLFYRVDNSSRLSSSRLWDWDKGDGATIVSYVRLIIRAAIQSSPSTTPIKDPAKRDVRLGCFSEFDASKSFDYGLGGTEVVDGDDEEESMEIISTPD